MEQIKDFEDDLDELLNIYDECLKRGTEDNLFMFSSTSKITYASAGVAAFAASDKNIKWMLKHYTIMTVGPNKLNQLRHVLYFKNRAGIEAHMKKQALLMAPKFHAVDEILTKNLGGTGVGSWNKPHGGYFISFDAYPGCAKRIVDLCKQAGVVMTNAGATYPYGKDPTDSNVRIAPSYPELGELKEAIEIFTTCVLLAAVEKRLGE